MTFHTVQAIKKNLKMGASVITNSVTDRVEHKLKSMEKLVARKILGIAIVILGTVFLSLSVYFFLSETLQLGSAVSFFIIAIILLIVGIFLRSNERRSHKYEEI